MVHQDCAPDASPNQLCLIHSEETMTVVNTAYMYLGQATKGMNIQGHVTKEH